MLNDVMRALPVYCMVIAWICFTVQILLPPTPERHFRMTATGIIALFMTLLVV